MHCFIFYFLRCISGLILFLCVLGSITELVRNYLTKYRSRRYILYVEDDKAPIIKNEEENEDLPDGYLKEDKVSISMHLVKVGKGMCVFTYYLAASIWQKDMYKVRLVS